MAMETSSSAINVSSSEVRVTVTLVINASLSWLEKPTKSILTSHLATCIVFGLLTVTSLAFNLCLLLAICCSSSLKKVVLNQLVSWMSVTCLLDCSLNAPFSIYYMKTNTWLLGPTLCTLNASCLMVLTLLISWILCYMCIERYVSLYKLSQNRSCSLFCKKSIAMAIVFTFFCCIIFPVALGLVEVRAFPSRYSCFVAISKQLYYRILIILIFALPIFLSVASLLSAYAKNFRGIKDINCQRIELSYTELFFEESYLWNEWQTSKFVGSIMMLFIFLEFPIILTFMRTFTAPLKPTQLSDLENTNSTVHVSFPIAQVTPSNEKIYFWCKYAFCLAYPLVTFLLRKDIRKKLSVMMSLFRTSSSIPSNNSCVESPVPQEDCSEEFLVPQMWRRRRLSSISSLKSPIKFGRSRKGSLQFMDMSTGIAKWKANYDQKQHNIKFDKPFFADVFDDDEEIVEFASFQDLTEEEINSAELCVVANTSKDVAVQTLEKPLVTIATDETPGKVSDLHVEYSCVFDGRIGKRSQQKSRRLSKSFTCNRTNGSYVRCKYYMTFPKMSQSARPFPQFTETSTTSDLLRALQVKRSGKSGLAACNLIPRGTEELLDSPVECRDIVSL